MKSSSSMRQIANAAYGGLLAYGTVYDGLEKSSKILGSSLKKESVQVVEHQVSQEKPTSKIEYHCYLILCGIYLDSI